MKLFIIKGNPVVYLTSHSRKATNCNIMKIDFVTRANMFLKGIIFLFLAVIPCLILAQDVKTSDDTGIDKLTKKQIEAIRPDIEEEVFYHQRNPKLLATDINTYNYEVNKINSALKSAESPEQSINFQKQLTILDEKIKECENKKKYIERYLELKNKDSDSAK